MVAHGEALIDADEGRIGVVRALSPDETLSMGEGPWRTQRWSTQLVDARSGQLLEVVEGRDAAAPAAWLADQDPDWLARIGWAVMDLSGPYRATFDTMVPDTGQVADRFHVEKHANPKLDECRRRVQNKTLGHRGRRNGPLYRCRRLRSKAEERLGHQATTSGPGCCGPTFSTPSPPLISDEPLNRLGPCRLCTLMGTDNSAPSASATPSTVSKEDRNATDVSMHDFFERLWPTLLGAMRLRTLSAEAAEDIAQEALVRAAERWGRVSAMENPEGWVFRVAFNLAKRDSTRLRRRRRQLNLGTSEQVPFDDELPDLDVREALKSLPERQRTAVVARYWLDLSVSDTAEVMRCSPGTVKALCSQGRSRLDKELKINRNSDGG